LGTLAAPNGPYITFTAPASETPSTSSDGAPMAKSSAPSSLKSARMVWPAAGSASATTQNAAAKA
jgi:hypothetical protein